jgi:arsenical pump membrane protein
MRLQSIGKTPLRPDVNLRELATVAIFLGTIAAIITRPRGVAEWVWALGGAIVLIVFGLESAVFAFGAVAAQVDVLLFFAGLMTMIAVAEQAGFFEWIAFLAASLASGSSTRLFLGVMTSTVILTVFLTNDAGAIVMTPIVYAMTLHLRIPPRPFVLACAFLANGASLILPISNPVNFIVSRAAAMDFLSFIRLVTLPGAAAAVMTVVALWWTCRRSVRGRFDEARVTAPPTENRFLSETIVLLIVSAAALIAALAAGWRVGLTACLCGLGLTCHALLRRRLDLGRMARDANPGILALVASLFCLADALLRSGALALPAAAIETLATARQETIAPVAAAGLAALSNLVNNLPASMIAIATMHAAHLSNDAAQRFAAGTIVGCDLGPNFTTVGSLSTLLWLVILRRRGYEVRTRDYFRVALVVGPVTLAVAILVLFAITR